MGSALESVTSNLVVLTLSRYNGTEIYAVLRGLALRPERGRRRGCRRRHGGVGVLTASNRSAKQHGLALRGHRGGGGEAVQGGDVVRVVDGVGQFSSKRGCGLEALRVAAAGPTRINKRISQHLTRGKGFQLGVPRKGLHFCHPLSTWWICQCSGLLDRALIY